MIVQENEQADVWADIDLGALRTNIQRIRREVSPADLMAVVKSSAYGHGMVQVALASYEAGVRYFGSLTIREGLALRAAGLPRDARIFAWLHTPDDTFAEAVAAGIELGVSTVAELNTIATAGNPQPAHVHLKIDTGLRRNGARAEDWPAVVECAASHVRAGSLTVEGIWSHLAEASDEADTAALREFDAAIRVAESRGLPVPLRHIAASCAGLTRADARYDLVRMGAFPLGISPGDGISPRELALRPVMTMRARIIDIRRDDAGNRRALLAAGFDTGLSSAYAGKATVSVHGVRCPLLSVGVSESEVALDNVAAEIGDTCTLFGPGDSGEPTLQEWADSVGTIGEEIVARLAPTLVRHYHS